MPEVNNPGKLLRAGQFYSPMQGQRSVDGVLLSELRQPCSRSVPRHEHELAYVTVMLSGDYLEGDHGKLEAIPSFGAVFNPSGVRHATVIGPAGASFFTIELPGHYVRELDMRLPERTTFDRGAGNLLWPGLRLYSAFKGQATESLLFDSYLLELIGGIAEVNLRHKAASATVEPRWFRRAKELLHEQFRENLRVRDLARDAGVHPVHLARVFRRIERQTPGDYLQRLRVRAACRLLRERELPLAFVAADCGFADQSHLTRVFRKLTGTTPARLRQAMTTRSGG